ncbi:glycosyltransferase family 2 protein [Bacillus wiedmannii]|uniref:glycosyltransferase family 2 protein n=1 Tax=Bacillus wiedmannii TaxID=1890302 RepID=UPI003D9911B7
MVPKISVILPVYNVEEYLDEAIQSIISQTIGLEYIEVIFVDDGSKDGSVDIIKKYQENYPFQLIQIDGPSGAAGKPRNIGMKHAKANYLVFMDPDDVLEIDGLQKLYEAIERYQSDIVTGKFVSFNSFTQMDPFEPFEDVLKEKMVNIHIEDYAFLLKVQNNLCSKIFKRAFIENNGIEFPEGVIAQDTFFVQKSYLITNNLTFIPESIFKYRVREKQENPSVSQIQNLKYFQDFSTVRAQLIELYKEYPRINYYDFRYFSDLKFLLFQLQRTSKVSVAEKVECIKVVEWILELSHMTDTSTLDEERKALLEAIKAKDYGIAISYMNIDPLEFNKSKFAKIKTKQV